MSASIRAPKRNEAPSPLETGGRRPCDRKAAAIGIKLGFPHTSKMVGADNIRELRPRASRSRVRPLYRRVGGTFVIAAIGPEAQSDPTGYKRSIRIAEQRLAAIER